MNLNLFFLIGFLISPVSMAEDRIPLIPGEKETFGMVDLEEDQCSLEFSDTDTGWRPNIDLKALTRRSGNFFGKKYLQEWNNDSKNKEYIVSIEYFVGDTGRKVIMTEIYTNYGKKFDDNDVIKNARHVIFLNSSNEVVNFMEKLGTKKPGFIKITDLVSVPQNVFVSSKSISYKRQTDNGIIVTADCKLME
jgi:hypothetical protein